MLDRLRQLLGGDAAARNTSPSDATVLRTSATKARPAGEQFVRQSNGLEQFFDTLRERGSLSLLDFAGASQENISFITSMGHRLNSEDFVRAIEQTFGEQLSGDQPDPLLVDEFVRENLNFPPDSFDGVLVWDSLQFLPPHLLQLTVDRLYEALRPGACLLAFFSSDEKAREIPVYHYRIADERTITLTLRGSRSPAHVFNNRSIEKLFHRFSSVKFFLARNSLREVIVRR